MKKVCITGYGSIGPIHAAALAKAENAELYAICDINEDRRKRCQETYDVIGYESFDEMLKDENIDSVHICTPHYLHYEMTVKALAAGKTVVAEKPVTMTREEYQQLLGNELAEKVCVVLQNRLNPCTEMLKELVDGGTLGKIKAIKGIVTWHRTKEYYARDAWRGKWATEGGGVLINQTVHTLDLLIYLAGKVTSLKGNMFNYSMEGEIEVEDTAIAYLKFEDGLTGIFMGTNAYADDTAPQIEVIFEKGTARYMDNKLWVNGEKVAEDSKPLEGKAYWGVGHERLIRDYYDKGQYFNAKEIEDTMNTMFAFYESAANGGKEIIV